jgi:Tol biopolymer transport system component
VPGFETLVQSDTPGGLRLSPDLLTGYYNAYGPDRVYVQLYSVRRPTPADPFAYQTILSSMPPNGEFRPTVSGDGLTLVFELASQYSTARHLYYASRAAVTDSFGDAGPPSCVNSSGIAGFNDFAAFLREDGQVLYFASNRANPGSCSDPTNLGSCDNDIYSCPAFGSPLPVAELNSSADDEAPVVTPDDLTIYFASTRSPPAGGVHVWMAKRASTSERFSNPTIVQELNLPGTILLPTFVSRDGCSLYLEGTLSSSVPWAVYVAQKPR